MSPTEPNTPANISLAIYSDVVCPWCYVGLHRLERGLEAAGATARIAFLPYELNPGMPAEGVERTAYLDAKFGPGKRAEIEQRLTQAAAETGLTFDWPAVKRTPNSRKAHVLIAVAAGMGQGHAVKAAIMKAYFSEGRDIGDAAVLCEIGERFGLDKSEILTAFVDPTLAAEIDQLEQQARAIGVEGVPFFIINETHAVSGAQTPDIWVGILEELGAREQPQT